MWRRHESILVSRVSWFHPAPYREPVKGSSAEQPPATSCAEGNDRCVISCVCQLYWTSSSSIRLAVVTHHDPRHSQACVRFSPAVFACCFTQTTSDRGEQAFHSSSSCCAQKTLPLRAVRSDSSCWIPDAVCGRTGAQHPRLMYRST